MKEKAIEKYQKGMYQFYKAVFTEGYEGGYSAKLDEELIQDITQDIKKKVEEASKTIRFKKREYILDLGDEPNEMRDQEDLENMAYGAKQFYDKLQDILNQL